MSSAKWRPFWPGMMGYIKTYEKVLASARYTVSTTIMSIGVDIYSQHIDDMCEVYASLVYLQSLQWRHNERDVDSNHQPYDCLLMRLFRHKSKKTSTLCVTGLREGNSPVTGEFPTQRAGTRKIFPFDDVIMNGGISLALSH